MEQLIGFTVVNRTVEFDTAPTADVLVTIYRVTPTEPLVGWADASVIKALDMTVSQIQQLHIIEENRDWSRTNSIVLEDNVYNMRFHRIINVADPQDPQDVVTKNYMESVQGGFVQQNTALKDEATKQAGIATTKAGEASTSASAAKVSETNAQKWAESPDSPDGQRDSESPTGETMSAKEWALYAKQLALDIGNPVVSVTESGGTIKIIKSNAQTNSISVLTPSMKNTSNGIAGLDERGKILQTLYDFATQEEAEVGTNNHKPTTSRNIKQAIDKRLSILDYVTETYKNGTEWYRKYKSGWIEQGGIYKSALSGNKNASINFLTPFADTNYTLLICGVSNSDTSNVSQIAYSSRYDNRGISSFNITSNGTVQTIWYACGQGA